MIYDITDESCQICSINDLTEGVIAIALKKDIYFGDYKVLVVYYN